VVVEVAAVAGLKAAAVLTAAGAVLMIEIMTAKRAVSVVVLTTAAAGSMAAAVVEGVDVVAVEVVIPTGPNHPLFRPGRIKDQSDEKTDSAKIEPIEEVIEADEAETITDLIAAAVSTAAVEAADLMIAVKDRVRKLRFRT